MVVGLDVRRTQHAGTAFDVHSSLIRTEGTGESALFPYLAFLTNYPPPHLLHLVPYELACRYQCVPLGAERRMLTVATCHWLNREVTAHLHAATRRKIFQVRCERATLDEVLHYWQRLQQTADPARAQVDEVCHSSR